MLIWGNGRTRPPRELAVVIAAGFAGWLMAWAMLKAIDFGFAAWAWGWRP